MKYRHSGLQFIRYFYTFCHAKKDENFKFQMVAKTTDICYIFINQVVIKNKKELKR